MQIAKIHSPNQASFGNRNLLNQSLPKIKHLGSKCGNALSKELLALGVLGLVGMQSCVKNVEIVEPMDIEIGRVEAPKLLVDTFDEMLVSLGLIQAPANSLSEVETISFNCEGTKYYIQPQKVSNCEVILRQIKISPDYKGNESFITIKKEGGFISVVNSNGVETRYQKEENQVKSYKNVNGLWAENSTLENLDENTILLKTLDGKEIFVKDIKNNVEMPEMIAFTPDVGTWESEAEGEEV